MASTNSQHEHGKTVTVLEVHGGAGVKELPHYGDMVVEDGIRECTTARIAREVDGGAGLDERLNYREIACCGSIR